MPGLSPDVLALLEATFDAAVIADDRGRMLAFNAAAEQMFGYRAAEALGRNVSILMGSTERARGEPLRSHFVARQARILASGRDVRVRHRDGSEFLAFLRVGRLPHSEPPLYVGYLQDSLLRDARGAMTGLLLSVENAAEQRHAEQAAHRARDRMNSVSRLATMGEMAAGISHELNQPLAAIANYARACVRLLRSPAVDLGEIGGALEQISGQALRAGEIIRRIRSLVRNEDVRREPQDLNVLIREVHALLASDARVHDGRLTLELQEPLPRVTVDKVRIQQVLMNLVHNAFEAQGSDAGARQGVPAHARITTRLTDKSMVEIAVSDHGPGLPTGLEQRIFEPFFTTKVTGTGLGLAISRSIVSAHGSRLCYRVNPPRGACFFFALPMIGEPSS